MKKKTTVVDLLATLKDAILNVLKDERSTPADKNKAIELGVKLAMVEAKIEARGDDGQDDSFFKR